jgi:predicted acyl esterase
MNTSIAIERDLAVPMRDGVRLFANLYRPAANGPHPVTMSVTPYGKDKLPDRVANFFSSRNCTGTTRVRRSRSMAVSFWKASESLKKLSFAIGQEKPQIRGQRTGDRLT